MAVQITYFVSETSDDNLEQEYNSSLANQLQEDANEDIASNKLIDINQFDIVFCSDLKRALDSIKYTFNDIKTFVEDYRLKEYYYKKQTDDNFSNKEEMLIIENQIKDFCNFLLKKYNGRHVAVIANKDSQLAFEVITGGKTWEETLNNEWHKNKLWQSSYNYTIR